MSYNHLSPNSSEVNDNNDNSVNTELGNILRTDNNAYLNQPPPASSATTTHYQDGNTTFSTNYVMGPSMQSHQVPYPQSLQFADPASREFQYISPPMPNPYYARSQPQQPQQQQHQQQLPPQQRRPNVSPFTVNPSKSSVSVDMPVVPAPGTDLSGTEQKKKRPRRKFHEVERIYVCNFEDCTKAYGTLNHLNSHIMMQKHGSKRFPEEFKEIRNLRRQERKRRKHEAKKLGINLTSSKKKANSISTIPLHGDHNESSSSISSRVYSNPPTSHSLPISYNQNYNASLSYGVSSPPSLEPKHYMNESLSQETVQDQYHKAIPQDTTEAYTGLISSTTFMPATYGSTLAGGPSSIYSNNPGQQIPGLSGLAQQIQHPPHGYSQSFSPNHAHSKLPTLQENQEGGNIQQAQLLAQQQQLQHQRTPAPPYFTQTQNQDNVSLNARQQGNPHTYNMTYHQYR